MRDSRSGARSRSESTVPLPRRSFPANRPGQGLIEYVLLIALASIGLILALLLFRNQVGNSVDSAGGTVQSTTGSYYVPGGGSSGGSGSPGSSGGSGGGSNSGRGSGNGGRGGGRGNSI